MGLLKIIFLIGLTFLLLNVLYVFILSLSSKLFYGKLNKTYYDVLEMSRIAILVPAYKEDYIILATAKNLLEQQYDKLKFDVYIIADSFQIETISLLKELHINVIEVSFDKSTKTKALNEAFKRIQKDYEIAVICDADNFLENKFLQKINAAFFHGERAVQGKRVAKNLDSSFAILDACSEGINNNIFRKGANAIGLSSSVIGSGMAFDFYQIKDVLSEIDAIGGFDKVMQLKLLERGIKIRYLDDAIVYDEKVENAAVFKQQRKRWVSSQFIYLRKFFFKALGMLMKGNFSYFNLAVLNNLVLPRAFLIVLLPLFTIISFLFYANLFLLSIIVTLIYGISLFLAMPVELFNKDLGRAILSLPKALYSMFSTVFHLKKANKEFIHTVHTRTEVSNKNYKQEDLNKRE